MSPKMTPLGRPKTSAKWDPQATWTTPQLARPAIYTMRITPAPASALRQRDQSSNTNILRMASRQLQLAAQAPYASFRNVCRDGTSR